MTKRTWIASRTSDSLREIIKDKTFEVEMRELAQDELDYRNKERELRLEQGNLEQLLINRITKLEIELSNIKETRKGSNSCLKDSYVVEHLAIKSKLEEAEFIFELFFGEEQ